MSRRFRHFLEDSFLRLCRLLGFLIPDRMICPLGRMLGLLFVGCLPPVKRSVLSELRKTFPEKSPEEIRTLFRKIARNTGEVFLEQMMCNEKIVQEGYRKIADWGPANTTFRRLYEQGRGIIVVASHLNNWEKLAGMNAILMQKHYGIEVNVVMNRMPTPYQDKVATVLRRKILRYNFVYARQARYHIDRILSERGLVAFATDVDFGLKGIFVPFMGRLISMGRGPAHYALKNHAPIGFQAYYRDEQGTWHTEFEEIWIEPTGDLEKDTYEMSAKLASRVEYWVRRYPEQWFGWVQQPWKTPSLETLESRLEKDPRNVKVLVQLGRFQAVKGREDEALGAFEKALAVDPEHHAAHLEMVRLCGQRGETAKEIHHLYRAHEIRPKDPGTLKQLGLFFLKNRVCRKAVQYFRSALRGKYDDAESYWGLGQCLERLDRTGEARRIYQKGLELNYDYGPLHEAMARLCSASPGDQERVEEHLLALRKLQMAPNQELLDAANQTRTR